MSERSWAKLREQSEQQERGAKDRAEYYRNIRSRCRAHRQAYNSRCTLKKNHEGPHRWIDRDVMEQREEEEAAVLRGEPWRCIHSKSKLWQGHLMEWRCIEDVAHEGEHVYRVLPEEGK